MKVINARVQAIKEMSREKARILRKKVAVISPLEEAALAWKKQMERDGRLQRKELLKKDSSGGLPFRDAVAKTIIEHDKRKLAGEPDEAAWVQYNPWKEEDNKDKKKKKEIPLNTATVVSIRKKLIAREWARALGKPPPGNRDRAGDLEREATSWEKKREAEKIRKEELRQRRERLRQRLGEALDDFGARLREVAKSTPDTEKLAGLLKESLENAGQVFDIEWRENGCLIWMEPWEEKKRRRISGDDIPVICRVAIDDELAVSSCDQITDETMLENLKERLLTRPLRESLNSVPFNAGDEEKAEQFLESQLSDIGRLINLERTGTGWLAVIESWEEMKKRNLNRGGEPPVVTEEIKFNWREGKLEYNPEEKKNE
ncbi:MAG: hypothetical protein RAO92_00205 [Candidatus Euphemobacter frigidus]|nr:hypothetical protein [Candidatus Euphemobacter frigidus]MDP8274800.1 hypothetical protein [Candidatus Euphemobacter frigidus]